MATMTIWEVKSVLRDIRYRDWRFVVVATSEFGYLQVCFDAPDNETGVDAVQKCRKWRLSHHMTISELVQTAWLAVKTAEEHEAREKFTWKGAAIYAPHLDCGALLEIAERRDVRQEEVRCIDANS